MTVLGSGMSAWIVNTDHITGEETVTHTFKMGYSDEVSTALLRTFYKEETSGFEIVIQDSLFDGKFVLYELDFNVKFVVSGREGYKSLLKGRIFVTREDAHGLGSVHIGNLVVKYRHWTREVELSDPVVSLESPISRAEFLDMLERQMPKVMEEVGVWVGDKGRASGFVSDWDLL